MPVQPLFEMEFFDPETIASMSEAFIDACRTIGLHPHQDPATKLIAMRIIDCAREGVHDVSLLKAAALDGLVPARPH